MQTRSICCRQTCPHCGSGEVHKTVWNGLVERIVLNLWGISPFQCRCCCKRFYRRVVVQNGATPNCSIGIN
jgi:hypothetical protein